MAIRGLGREHQNIVNIRPTVCTEFVFALDPCRNVIKQHRRRIADRAIVVHEIPEGSFCALRMHLSRNR